MGIIGGIIQILGKLSTYLPGRIEKLKNEKESLTSERNKLIGGKYNAKKGERVKWIDDRLDAINQLLGNKASD